MVDPDWIRNLASAQFGRGSWKLAEPERVTQLKMQRLKEALSELQDEAQASVSVHNQYAPRQRSLTYLATTERPPYGQGGFMILLGTLQVALELHLNKSDDASVKAALITELTILKTDYTRLTYPLARYDAQTDTFGTLVWRRENSLLMTSELIIKSLLEELTKAAFKIEHVNLSHGVGR